MAHLLQSLNPMPGWVSVRDASARLGVSVAWIRRHAGAEGIEVRFGCVPESAVEVWGQQARIGPGDIRARPPRKASK